MSHRQVWVASSYGAVSMSNRMPALWLGPAGPWTCFATSGVVRLLYDAFSSALVSSPLSSRVANPDPGVTALPSGRR
jgi:hypothetical protein